MFGWWTNFQNIIVNYFIKVLENFNKFPEIRNLIIISFLASTIIYLIEEKFVVEDSLVSEIFNAFYYATLVVFIIFILFNLILVF
ncbi:hypothetical protein K9L04_01450 [Patescibacteria group bacterium]|nr:hypothetical protein [Patescibacteria group bacterium]